jgi:excinuclease ABC subunit A
MAAASSATARRPRSWRIRTRPPAPGSRAVAACRRCAPATRRRQLPAVGGAIRLFGAAEHNLKQLDVELPLHRLVCLTGVSGSGKSTLVQDVLYPALQKAHGKPTEAPGRFARLEGAELIEAAVLIDQTPIGRTTRSNPASYVGAFDEIRARFAAEPEAKLRRYTAGTFSFNSGNGRCPTCGGNGFEHVEMQFLSDVYLRCGECNGTRYRSRDAAGAHPGRGRPARQYRRGAGDDRHRGAGVLRRCTGACVRACSRWWMSGLDYVRLGQPVPTLSGGEAQRLKLAGHLAGRGTGRGKARSGAGTGGKLLIFDEPTTGLHFEDIARLVHAFGLLLKAGHSLLVIEHNLDVIRAADWIIDLGPEGGERGGELVATATPQD